MQATFNEQATDRNLERLAREIGEIIEKARPEEREELRQMASNLISAEMVRTEGLRDESGNTTKRGLNPLALGAFVLIFGAGLSIVLPPVGLILMGGGLATILLGAMYHVITK
jgi:hypothetical protein